MPLSSKVAVILVHGGASSSRMYSKLKPILQESYHYEHIYTPDLPGHGKEYLDKPFTFEKSSNTLHKLIEDIRNSYIEDFILVVGISLGGQAVLDLINRYPRDADCVIVSGVSIMPPDAAASWEMPRLPTDDPEWMKIIMEDAAVWSTEEGQALQDCSFAFQFDPDPARSTQASILILRGEHDTPMSKRDFDELVRRASDYSTSGWATGEVIGGAWHNHPIDNPSQFAGVIDWWMKTAIGRGKI